MKALLRRDWASVSFFVATGCVAHTVLLASEGFDRVWVERDSELFGYFGLFYWIAAGAMGLALGLREDALQTRDYLLHRPISHARIFGARQVAAIGVLVAWALLPLASDYALAALHPNAPLIAEGRFFDLLANGAVALPSYAAGAFAAAFTRRANVLLLLAGAPYAALGLGMFGLRRVDPWATHPAMTTLGLLALAALLLLVTWRCESERDDADRPWSAARAWPAALVAVAAGGFVALLGLGELGSTLDQFLTRSYPRLVRIGDEPRFALAEYDADRGGPWLLDRQHRRGPNPGRDAERRRWVSIERDGALKAWWNEHSKPRRTRGVAWRDLGWGVEFGRAFFNADTGMVTVLREAERSSGRPAQVYRIGRGAEHAAFSARAFPLGRRWEEGVTVMDPKDATLWRCVLADSVPQFVPSPLPDGDRYREPLDLRELRDGIDGEPRALVAAVLARGDTPFAIRGERGSYLWNGTEFEPLPARLRAAAAELERTRARPTATITNRDPIVRELEVRDAQAVVVFEHTFTPQRLGERVLAAALLGHSLLRLPVAQVAALASATPHMAYEYWWRDGLLTGRKRAWLLVAHLAFAVALGWRCYRRLLRLGAPVSRCLGWAVLVGATGVLGWMLYRGVETRRAWHRPPVVQEPPRLLLRSA